MKDIIIPTLSVERLNTIFRNTLVTNKSTSVIKVVLFQQNNGFEQDSKPVFFDEYIIGEDKQLIEYLFGQLKDVHDGKMIITMNSAMQRYDGAWTSNPNAVMALLHLGLAAGLIEPYKKGVGAKLTHPIIPTMHTLDDDFPQWYKANKAKLVKAYFGE